MEALARKLLRRPLEITVGARSVVCEDVTQIVEVREDDTRFTRLLEILGKAYNDDSEARVLIFVSRQEAADNLLRDLIRRGYISMSIHGGKVGKSSRLGANWSAFPSYRITTLTNYSNVFVKYRIKWTETVPLLTSSQVSARF